MINTNRNLMKEDVEKWKKIINKHPQDFELIRSMIGVLFLTIGVIIKLSTIPVNATHVFIQI